MTFKEAYKHVNLIYGFKTDKVRTIIVEEDASHILNPMREFLEYGRIVQKFYNSKYYNILLFGFPMTEDKKYLQFRRKLLKNLNIAIPRGHNYTFHLILDKPLDLYFETEDSAYLYRIMDDQYFQDEIKLLTM